MKSIHLTAEEARRLFRKGTMVISKETPTEGKLERGDIVAIKEPWHRLQRPAGAYMLDAEPRYIRQSEATAEPLNFTYSPPETMPEAAVKRHAKVASLRAGCIRIHII